MYWLTCRKVPGFRVKIKWFLNIKITILNCNVELLRFLSSEAQLEKSWLENP